MTHQFTSYVLRTTDAEAAGAFYASVLGPGIFGGELILVPLHEQAVARGARPHWLGMLGVADVPAMRARFLEAGAEPLGPVQTGLMGTFAVLRDPFGALAGLAQSPEPPGESRVVWRILHARSLEPAVALYTELLGWTPTTELDLGPEVGRFQLFAWDTSGRSVGSVSNAAALPGVHAHWIFFFEVADLDTARDRVTAAGGSALAPMTTPNGARVCVCDDPQGAAFGLYQQPA